MKKYNSFPLGKLPKGKQRPELETVRELGYEWNDPRDVIEMFEQKVADFAGSKYAVSVDCCTNGLFLCLKYLNQSGIITIPSRTYASIPMVIRYAGYEVGFEERKWSGVYYLDPTCVVDGAVRWRENMYVGSGAYQVVSFQIKKRIPIGKGGMILLDDKKAHDWLKLARYDGRDMSLSYDDPGHFKTMGYHMYMTPEDAARGIILMDKTPKNNEDSGTDKNYPDLTQYKFDFISG